VKLFILKERNIARFRVYGKVDSRWTLKIKAKGPFLKLEEKMIFYIYFTFGNLYKEEIIM
jgi:hypothetical protein